MAVGGQTTNEAFWDTSGRIQATGFGGVARAAPNVDNLLGVRRTLVKKRYGGGRWWDGLGCDKDAGRLGKDKEPSGCTRRKPGYVKNARTARAQRTHGAEPARRDAGVMPPK